MIFCELLFCLSNSYYSKDQTLLFSLIENYTGKILLMNNMSLVNFILTKEIRVKMILEEDGELIKAMDPFIYKISRDNPLFTKKGFIFYMFKGATFGFFIFLVTCYSLDVSALSSKGYQSDIWTMSFVYFVSIFLLVSLSLIINMKYHTIMSTLTMGVISWIIFLLSLIPFHNITYFKSSGSYIVILTSSRVYLTIILNVAIGIIIEELLKIYQYIIHPSLLNILESMVYNKNSLIKNLGESMKNSLFKMFLEKYDNAEYTN